MPGWGRGCHRLTRRRIATAADSGWRVHSLPRPAAGPAPACQGHQPPVPATDLFQIQDLAVAVAVVAGFCTYRALAHRLAGIAVGISQGAIGDVLPSGATLAALHAHVVPLAGAQRARQVAVGGIGRAGLHHAGHRQGAAQRAQPWRIGQRLQVAGAEAGRQYCPIHLQRIHHQQRSDRVDRGASARSSTAWACASSQVSSAAATRSNSCRVSAGSPLRRRSAGTACAASRASAVQMKRVGGPQRHAGTGGRAGRCARAWSCSASRCWGVNFSSSACCASANAASSCGNRRWRCARPGCAGARAWRTATRYQAG